MHIFESIFYFDTRFLYYRTRLCKRCLRNGFQSCIVVFADLMLFRIRIPIQTSLYFAYCSAIWYERRYRFFASFIRIRVQEVFPGPDPYHCSSLSLGKLPELNETPLMARVNNNNNKSFILHTLEYKIKNGAQHIDA